MKNETGVLVASVWRICRKSVDFFQDFVSKTTDRFGIRALCVLTRTSPPWRSHFTTKKSAQQLVISSYKICNLHFCKTGSFIWITWRVCMEIFKTRAFTVQRIYGQLMTFNIKVSDLRRLGLRSTFFCGVNIMFTVANGLCVNCGGITWRWSSRLWWRYLAANGARRIIDEYKLVAVSWPPIYYSDVLELDDRWRRWNMKSCVEVTLSRTNNMLMTFFRSISDRDVTFNLSVFLLVCYTTIVCGFQALHLYFIAP